MFQRAARRAHLRPSSRYSVTVFRRRTTDAPDVLEQAPAEPAGDEPVREPRAGLTPKKAGPTPKRSEAEANRRQPYRAPTDRKGAYQDAKQRERSERQRKAAAMQRGEDWALPRKDQGPVRALARDVVDSRRTISEYYLVVVIPIFALLLAGTAELKLVADALVIAVLLVVVAEGWYVGRRVERLARERFPGESTRGVRMYAAMRGTQLRRMRIPKPKVDRGDTV
jgi:hypothetical protein